MCCPCMCGLCSSQFKATADFFYPVTIVSARYQGTYEGAPWLAFPIYPEDLINTDYAASDIECSEFYAKHLDCPIGYGNSPDTAIADLKEALTSDTFEWWVKRTRSRHHGR